VVDFLFDAATDGRPIKIVWMNTPASTARRSSSSIRCRPVMLRPTRPSTGDYPALLRCANRAEPAHAATAD
jgi:hypothetical protein